LSLLAGAKGQGSCLPSSLVTTGDNTLKIRVFQQKKAGNITFFFFILASNLFKLTAILIFEIAVNIHNNINNPV
jgi:hypothetical protein